MLAALALSCGTILMPPAQYDTAWYPDPVYRLVDYWDVDKTCRSLGGLERGRYEACTVHRVMVLPKVGNGVTKQFQDCLFRHERAHLAGWGYDHPGARYD